MNSPLIQAYKDYVALLENDCASFAMIADLHGFHADPKHIKEGERLRAKMKSLETKKAS